MKKTVFLSLLLSMVTLTPALASDELIIYSGRSDSFVKPVVKAFTEKTGIEVTLHSASSTALLNKMKLEGKRTEADLFLSNDAGNLEAGAEMGLFSAIPSEIADHIPANYRSPDNMWLGLSARARVLVVNKNSPFADKLHSVLDLAKPELKGHVGITHSANESFIAGVTVYQNKLGDQATKDWLKGLASNAGRNVYNKHSKIVSAVAKGKVDVGLVNHYYIFRHLTKKPNAPIKIVMPDQDGMGVAWNVAGVAVNKYSQKKEAALKFVDFVTSEAGQKLFAEVNDEYPTRPGVAAAEMVPQPGTFKVADVPMVELGRKRNATLDLLQAVDMP